MGGACRKRGPVAMKVSSGYELLLSREEASSAEDPSNFRMRATTAAGRGALSPPDVVVVRQQLLIMLAAALLLLVVLQAGRAQANSCDPRCVTNICDSDGACICDLPSNATMLQGDRPFMGGEYCNTPRTLCDGSNSFWCENGLCNEIIQGENYTCVCKEGHAGDHCELAGEPCGALFCYHNAECVESDGSCDCPADWKGSLDCSTPTVQRSENSTSIEPMRTEDDGNTRWHLPVLVAMAVVVLAGGAMFGVRSIRKRSMAASEFHRLQQVQMRGFIEEDEDAFAQAPLSKAELA